MSKKNRPFGIGGGQDMYWSTAAYNGAMYSMFRQQIITIAMTRFQWVNLPRGCDERYLEWTLLTQGMATIAFPTKQPGVFYSTQCVTQSPPNVYDDFTKWNSIGNGGWKFPVTGSNGVIVWDNNLRVPLLPWIDVYAKELADIMRTQQINRLHVKTPVIITGPQEKRVDMNNLYKAIAQGEPAIIGTDGLSSVDVNVMNTGVAYLGSELNEALQNTWNSVYRMLGIPNIPFKAERQIEDEVTSQTMPSQIMSLGSLEARRRACDKLNNRFGKYLDKPIDVVMRADLETQNYRELHSLDRLIELEEGDADGADEAERSETIDSTGTRVA